MCIRSTQIVLIGSCGRAADFLFIVILSLLDSLPYDCAVLSYDHCVYGVMTDEFGAHSCSQRTTEQRSCHFSLMHQPSP